MAGVWARCPLFRRGIRWLAIGSLAFWVITLAPPALGQLPWFVNPSAPVSSGSDLPAGVLRYGDLEVAPVVSPYTSDKLFLVASSALLDREAPPEHVIPVEARARDIEGRLRLAYRRIGTDELDSPPQVDIGILNQTPILMLSDHRTSRSLALVTVTEPDSAFHGKTREQLAEDWEKKLQQEVNHVYHLTRKEESRRRTFYGMGILLGLVAFSLVVWLLRRLLNRRQDFLRLKKQEEDRIRANLMADTAATQEKHCTDMVQVNEREATELSQDTWQTGGLDSSATADESTSLLDQHRALLASFRQKFSLKRRIRFYTLLKWIVFWVTVVVWYLGLYAIANTIPFLMRWQFWILSTPLKLLVIWFAVGLAIRISHALIDASTIKRFSTAIPTEIIPNPAEEQRRELQASTITGALEGLATVGFIAVGIIGTLNSFSIPTGSILAGGAIVGLAISFGSQSLVKDLVNGSLILLEDQFAIGDVVAIEGDAGVVENVNLRITQIRNTQGELITIPNSSITRVKNMTRLWSRVDFAIEVAYENDVDAVMTLLDQLAQAMYQEDTWHQLILESPEMLGVDQLSHTGMVLRLWIKTAPMQQWAVGREYRRRVRRAFSQHNIQIGRPEWISYTAGWHGPTGNGGEASDVSAQSQ